MKEKSESELGKKHPYVIYLGLTALLFLFLILMAYLAIENDWLPNRGNQIH